jgi:hypothetical protein
MAHDSRIAAGLLGAVVCATQLLAPATAHQLEGSVHKGQTGGGVKQFFQEHPKIKSATVGAGLGAAAGAGVGLISGKGIGRGAAIGAGTGAGVGLIRASNTMKAHPAVKNTATGAVVGLGLGLAATRGHGKTGRVVGATAAGAAAGLGYSLLKDKLR